jgi:ribonuclease P protein component
MQVPVKNEEIVLALTFNKYEKLKSKKLTQLLFTKGKSFHSFPFRIVYLFNDPAFAIPESKEFKEKYPLQFGVSVGTKNFRKATDRNTIKRRTREAWRLQKQHCYTVALKNKQQLALFFIYTQKEILPYSGIETGITNAVKKINQIIEN